MNSQAVKDIMEKLEQVEKLKREQARGEGKIEQLLGRLKEEFACKNLKDAQVLLEELQQELASKERELEKLSSEFDEKYRDKLESL